MSPLGMHNSLAGEPTTEPFIPSYLAPEARASAVFVSGPKELAADRGELGGGLQAFWKGEKELHFSIFYKKTPHYDILHLNTRYKHPGLYWK